MVERFINKFIAVCLIFALLPVLTLLGLYVFFFDGSPILFIAKRLGQNATEFNMYKFRTMRVNAPLVPHSQQNHTDVTIVPLRLLRAMGLDELPQLFNIVLGDINFFGPRPAMASEHELIKLRTKYGIIKSKPGITGLAQVIARNLGSVHTKIRLERLHLNNQSLVLKIKILFLTFTILLTTSKFKG